MTKQRFEQLKNKSFADIIISDSKGIINFNMEQLLALYNNQANEEQRRRIKDYIVGLLDSKEEVETPQEEKEPTRKKPMTEEEIQELQNKIYVDITIDYYTSAIDENVKQLISVYNDQANEDQRERILDYFYDLMNKKVEELNKNPEKKEPTKNKTAQKRRNNK